MYCFDNVHINTLTSTNNLYRFQVVYEILSVRFNSRIRVKCLTNELIPLNSIEKIFIGASWWECEVWDMYGIFLIIIPIW